MDTSRVCSIRTAPARPADGVQRGSVMDMVLYPGDPQTPGIGAVPGAKLIPLAEVQTITKIPVLPISYNDAKPFLEALGGQVVPRRGAAALPMTYKVGPSVAKAHLALAFNWDRKPLYDVIARIPGSTYPDQWVIRGNHHDGWVNGAEDPLSGTSAELEEARGLGELVKQGWRRSGRFSTASGMARSRGCWVRRSGPRRMRRSYRGHAVAYFNSDGNGRGYFRAEGSQSLENFVDGVAKDIEDPETKMPVAKRERLVDISRAAPEARAEIRARADQRLPRWVRVRTIPCFCTISALPASTWGTAARTRTAGSTTPSTTTSTFTHTFWTRISSTGGRWRRPPER